MLPDLFENDIDKEFARRTSLLATTPGEEGKWFATAREVKHFDLALELADRSHCDPKTLTRAAGDYLDSAPTLALGSAMAAASGPNKIDDVSAQIRQIVESKESAYVLFVRQSLQGRMRAHSSSTVNTVRFVVFDGLAKWCRGEDLNLHGVTPTST